MTSKTHLSKLVERILDGDVLSASRVMRELQHETPRSLAVLKRLYRRTGRAWIIGVTGPPGVGKSTLIDRLTQCIRDRGQTVGIIAIDPSSTRSGGAILGDRIRMHTHGDDDGVFIHSLATKGQTGGLSRAAYGVLTVMDAMGRDVIVVESVGAGQAEIDLVHLVYTTVVVVAPNMGDGLQCMKAGLMEIGDVFVVNKTDLGPADTALGAVRAMVAMQNQTADAWPAPVIGISALKAQGMEDLVQQLERHRAFVKKLPAEHGQRQLQTILTMLFKDAACRAIEKRLTTHRTYQDLVTALAQRRIDPYSAAETLLEELIPESTFDY